MLIKKQFSYLQYKGEKIEEGAKANEKELESFYDVMKKIDDKINWNSKTLKKKDVMASEKVQEFYSNHVTTNQYCFQIQKCLNKSCPYHKPVRMDKEQYGSLKWLPMPTLSLASRGIGQKYKQFQEAHAINEIPTDRDRPYGKESIENKEQLPPLAGFKCVAGYARQAVWCKECGKPRLLYSQKVINDKDHSELQRSLENFVYSCGGPILQEDHFLANKVFVQPRVTCNTNISSQYYSRREMIEGFRLICFSCLRENNIAIEDADITRDYKSFLPRCNDCKRLGKIGFTMKKNVKRSKNEGGKSITEDIKEKKMW